MNFNLKGLRTLVAIVVLLGAPLAAWSQAVPAPAGDWVGTLDVGTVKLRLVMHLGAASTFDSPDQGALGIPARMTVEGRRVTVTIEQVGVFEGDLSADGETLSGVLTQGPARIPVSFTRAHDR